MSGILLDDDHTKSLTRHMLCGLSISVEDRAQGEITNAHGLPDATRLSEAAEIRPFAVGDG
jgi:hypothetical protein